MCDWLWFLCILQLGSGYSGNTVGLTEGSTQVSLSSRHSSILGASQEAEVGGYRSHSSVAPHYGGQYSSVYGSGSLSAPQQVRKYKWHCLH